MITIYKRNLWPDIVREQHPRYMALSDFTVALDVEEGPVADALEADPLLQQKITDAINDFVNNKAYRFLSDKVFRVETRIFMHINNRDFDSLADDYRSFDEYTRYLLSLTNDNVKYLVGQTIKAVAKDKKAVAGYKRGIIVKMVVKIARILFSTTTMVVGTTTAIFTCGTTAIPGLIIGFVGLVQSFAELTRELLKAIKSLELARVDALVSLKDLEKKYKNAGGGSIGTQEVLRGVANKVFSGFIEINTITTLSGKFDLWENKIRVVDQKSHQLAQKLTQILQKANELQRVINMESRPSVPSREGCKLKVPPPIPSREGRRTINSSGQISPLVPSRQGRVNANVYKDMFSQKTPPPVPSRFGRASAPAKHASPPPANARSAENQAGDQKTKKTMKLASVRRNIMKTIPKIEKLQKEVNVNKRQNKLFTTALSNLKGRKPRAVEFIEAFMNVTVDLTKAGISFGVGSYDLHDGLSTAKGVTDSIYSIGSFILDQSVESVVLSNDLLEGFGELGNALNEKDRLDRDAGRKGV